MSRYEINQSDKRGAALILEIIIYLVIVTLIAVAVTSGINSMKELAFTSSAKQDIKNVQSWVEGKYSQDGQYPSGSTDTDTGGALSDPALKLTQYAGTPDTITKINSKTGSDAGYCIGLRSGSLSINKRWFWISSLEPNRIMQSGTLTAPGGLGAWQLIPSGIPGLNCP